jgi:hypothetical protein
MTHDEARRQQALTLLLFLCAAVAFTLRIVISPQLLNRVMDYTADGGSFYEKLHVGTYAVLLLLPVVLFTRPIRLWGNEIAKFRALIRFTVITTVLTAYLFVTDRAGSSGFVIDTYLVGAAAGMIALALGAEARRALGELVLCVLLASAILGILEAVFEHRLLPFDAVEDVFRPIGLTSHPLALGALCATAIGFAALARWRLWIRAVAIGVLYLGCAASGARLALLVASVEIIALLLLVPWPRLAPPDERRAKLAALLLALAMGAALITVLAAGGLLSRFQNSLFDESFMARVTIYQVFEYVSLKQILLGMDINDLIVIVNEKLGIKFIESTPVFLVMVFGLFAALLFAALVVMLLRRLLAGTALPARIATITYFVISLSNNALNTKTPELLILFVLLLAFASANGKPGRQTAINPDYPQPQPVPPG